MARLDEHLRHELERAARPADPSGVYEHLIRRKERRRIARRAQVGALAVAVVAGSIAGVYGLSQVFRVADRPGSGGVSNGLIAYLVLDPDGGEPGTSVHVANPDGSGSRELARFDTVSGLDWSPDGTRLAFVAAREMEPPALYVMNADGSDLTRITDVAGGPSAPSWSPNGRSIAFVDRWQRTEALFVIGADGTERRRLTDDTMYVAFPDWSPDGTQIAFSSEEPNVEPEFWDIYIIGVNGSGLRQLTTHPAFDLEPKWSPDGSTILFRSRRDPPPGWTQGDPPDELYLIAPDGSDVRRLTDDTVIEQWATWSPDGSLIVFERETEDGSSGLFTIRPDGTGLTDLGIAGLAPAWQAIPTGDDVSTVTETPTETSPPPVGEAIGLGLRLCDVTSVRGNFLGEGAETQTAFVGTEPAGDGCPRAEEITGIAAIDLTGDGQADVASEPFECQYACAAYAAPDVDGDGTDELLVQNVAFTIVGVRLFDLVPDEEAPALVTAMVEPPGDAVLGMEGFDGSGPPQFWIGGDAFIADSLRCEPSPAGRVLISTTAESLPHDAPDAVWQVHETVFSLEDGVLRVIDARDFEEPVGAGTPAFLSRGGCGADLEPGS